MNLRHHQAETDERHRSEIATAMNSVIRACQDVVTAHSNKGFWTPGGSSTPPPCLHLIHTARRQALDRLATALDCAEVVLHQVEQEHRPQQRP